MANIDSAVRREAGDIVEVAQQMKGMIESRKHFLSNPTREKLKEVLENIFNDVITE